MNLRQFLSRTSAGLGAFAFSTVLLEGNLIQHAGGTLPDFLRRK